MNKFNIITFFLLIIASIVKSINIDCGYYDGTSNFYALKGVYTCQILSVKESENHQALVTGSHISGKSNNDVIGIWDSNGRLQSFPRNLGSVFKNLVAFYISGGHIKEIHQEHLKPYPNMIALIFDGSNIEVIEQGLFDFNPHLEAVSFDSKKIHHISPGVFADLPNLRFLMISGCASIHVKDNRLKVQNEIEKANQLCHDDQDFIKLEEIIKNLISAFKIMLKNHENDFKNINDPKFSYLKKKFQYLQNIGEIVDCEI